MARDEPVAQAIGGLRLAPAFLGQPGGHRRLGLRDSEPIELAGVDEQGVLTSRGIGLDLHINLAVCRSDDLANRETEQRREGVVAIVVAWNGHDRAGAVLDEHIVRDPDRNLLERDGIDDAPTSVDARLGPVVAHAVSHRLGATATDVVHYLGLSSRALHKLADQRMLGRQHEKGGPKQGVRTRRKDGNLGLAIDNAKDHLGAMRTPDPVALHRQYALGPVFQLIHVIEQTIGVVGDAEEPLVEIARLDLGAATLAAAVHDLLVGEHRLVLRTPLDGSRALVRQTALEHLKENPLRPAVVGRVRRRELATPVDRPAHAQHLLTDARDVVRGYLSRLATRLDRSVLGRETKRVVAHRVKHLKTGAATKVRDDVAHRVVGDMPHV